MAFNQGTPGLDRPGGTDGVDSILGHGADDRLHGLRGAGSLFGGQGDGTAFGDGGDETFIEASQGDFSGYLYDGGAGADTRMIVATVTVSGGWAGLLSIEVTI